MTLAPRPTRPPASLRILLENLIDYAGLFPPAKLAMQPAEEHFKTYCDSEHAWMLGRFIVPASRLPSLIGPNIAADLAAVSSFNRHSSAAEGVLVDAVELKAQTCEDVRNA